MKTRLYKKAMDVEGLPTMSDEPKPPGTAQAKNGEWHIEADFNAKMLRPFGRRESSHEWKRLL